MEPKKRKILLIPVVIAVAIVAAGAFFALTRPREVRALMGGNDFSVDQNRIVGTLEKVDVKSSALRLRLDDGSARVFHYGKQSFFLIDGRTSPVRSLRIGEQAAVAPEENGDTVEYLMQGAWRCAPDGSVPRSKDPTLLQCPPKK